MQNQCPGGGGNPIKKRSSHVRGGDRTGLCIVTKFKQRKGLIQKPHEMI
jgi:hypothetical protein